MSRAKGARLWLQPGRPDRNEQSRWVIRDGTRKLATGCGAADVEQAERKLREYLARKHDPRKARSGDPLAARLPDIIALYAEEVAPRSTRPAEVARRLSAVLAHFGDVPLSTIDRSACIGYATARGKPQAARRELEDLSAAVNHYFGDRLVGVKFNIALPDKSPRREIWHTRSEFAKLLWTAWRKAQATPNGGRRYVARHIARFMLVAFYTGTRATAICEAALGPAIGRGHVDLEQGVFYRRAPGTAETIKRRPPVRLHPKLLAHMRRWAARGICKSAIVEWEGKPVKRVSKGYAAVSKAAGIKSSPHALRHTSVTLAMQGGAKLYEAAEFYGMTLEILQRVYGHHHPDHQAGVLAAIGGKRA